MRKPLTVIIVTLSVVCTLKAYQDGGYKGSKQCYCVLSMVSCLSTLSIQRSKHAMHWMLCLSRLSILLSKHIHTFLPITFLIFNGFFNPQKVLESWDSGLFNHTINTIYVDTVDTRQGSLMHSMLSMLTTVDTKHIHTFLLITFLIFNQFSICKKFWKAETQGFSTIPSILYMSTLLIQDKDL